MVDIGTATPRRRRSIRREQWHSLARGTALNSFLERQSASQASVSVSGCASSSSSEAPSLPPRKPGQQRLPAGRRIERPRSAEYALAITRSRATRMKNSDHLSVHEQQERCGLTRCRLEAAHDRLRDPLQRRRAAARAPQPPVGCPGGTARFGVSIRNRPSRSGP